MGVHIHWILADDCRERKRERERDRKGKRVREGGERERERGGVGREKERERLKHYSHEYNKSLLTVEVVGIQEDISTAVLARVNVAASH